MEPKLKPPESSKIEPLRQASAAERLLTLRPKKEKYPQKTAVTPENSTTQRLGGRALRTLSGELIRPKPKPEAAVSASLESTDFSEVNASIARAGRIRRFASRVIAHVRGEAAAEVSRASQEHVKPLDTAQLVEAAQDLRGASDELGDTMRSAEETLIFDRQSDVAPAHPNDSGDFVLPSVAERIAQRVDRLEARVESSNTASLAAVGLGVVAVLFAGHEYFVRRRTEKGQKRINKEQKALNDQLREQQQAFAVLQKAQASSMDRSHRHDYYNQLSQFTHEQAATTREASHALQQTVESHAALPVLEALPESRGHNVPPTPELPVAPEPLRQVEQADTFEHGSQTGNAGNGFFGGGMVGLNAVGGQIKQALGLRSVKLSGKASSSADAQRQARLAHSAWLYSAGFVIAVIALVMSLIFSA